MKRDAAVQLLRRWWPLAATIAPSRPGMLAWAGVYPLDPQRIDTQEVLKIFRLEPLIGAGPLYRIRLFEVDEKLINADVWIGEEELHSSGDLIVVGEEALFKHLAERGVGPDALELPDKVDYPI